MSGFERRLQLLLDQERFDRVSTEARITGQSVAAVIREAIDLRCPDDHDARSVAARILLDMTSRPDDAPEPDWTEVKRALADDMGARLP